jgi:hypothetical protein
MLDCGGQKVLIDALFRDSLENYVRHSPEQQERIETGKAPFDGVRLALATQPRCISGKSAPCALADGACLYRPYTSSVPAPLVSK